jgi:hypothetical protein
MKARGKAMATEPDIEERSIFESVYDEERKRWTLRRIRAASALETGAGDSLPVASGLRASDASVERDRRERPTVVAPQGAVTTADGAPIPDPPAPRKTPLIGAPSDLAIPMRTSRPLDPGAPLDVRIAFLLCHVDNRSTIAEIACFVERPVAEVASAFGLLTAMGVVELVGNISAPPAPRESGVRPAVADLADRDPPKKPR